MDIRNFFGSKKSVKPAAAAAAAPSSAPSVPLSASLPELKTTVRRTIADADDDIQRPVDAAHRAVAPDRRPDDSTDFAGSSGKRKRLKKVVDSDDDADADESTTPSTEHSGGDSRKPGVVRSFLKQQLDGDSSADPESKGRAADLQLDIDYYTTNEKHLVNPVTNVTSSRKPCVDFDSYLSTVGVGSSDRRSSIDSMFDSGSSKHAKGTPSTVYSANEKLLPSGEATATTAPAAASATGDNTAMDIDVVPPAAADLFSDTEPVPSPQESPTRSTQSRRGKDSPKGAASPAAAATAASDGDLISGMRFVFTGVMSTLDRDSAIQVVRDLGGIPVTSVSGKTNYLVCGEKLEDGRVWTDGSKYKKSQELNKQQRAEIRILTEPEFLKLIDYDNVKQRMFKSEDAMDVDGVVGGAPCTDSARPSPPAPEGGLPFCEKYRPSQLGDVVGNDGNVRKVVEWLRNWAPGTGNACALISGPPGVGKTTTAKLIAAECGYECVEFNASDLRNKSAVERISMLATGGQSFSFLGKCEVKRSLVLLDEVDGMGGGDRGGLQAVAALLPRARCPIICICNDRHNQKMTTLGNKSLDVRFSAPTLMQFSARMARICKAEGITIPPDAVAQLYEQSGGDFRHALNAIEFNSVRDAGGAPVSSSSGSDSKDIGHTKNLFEATGKMFSVRSSEGQSRFRDIEQIFFIDYNIMPLMVQENYLKYLDQNRRTLPLLQKLSHTFVYADIVEEFVKRRQAFSLLPDLAVLSSIVPAVEILRAKGVCRERLMFPQFLGRFSTTSKNRRFLSEIGKHLGPRSMVRSVSLVTDGYLGIVYTRIMRELIQGDIEATAALIESYGLTRELVVDALCSLRLKSQENLYEKIETRKKSALTRRLNEQTVRMAPSKRKKEAVERIVDDEAEVSAGSDSESSASEGELLKKNQKPARKRAAPKAGGRAAKK